MLLCTWVVEWWGRTSTCCIFCVSMTWRFWEVHQQGRSAFICLGDFPLSRGKFALQNQIQDSHLPHPENQPGDTGSKAFPVNDFTCGRKGQHSFGLMRHSVWKWVWPALGQFAEVYFFVFLSLFHGVSPWPGSQVARFPTGKHQAKGWMMSDKHQRSPWNGALRVVKQWKVTAYLQQRAICAPDSELRELEPQCIFPPNCLRTILMKNLHSFSPDYTGAISLHPFPKEFHKTAYIPSNNSFSPLLTPSSCFFSCLGWCFCCALLVWEDWRHLLLLSENMYFVS